VLALLAGLLVAVPLTTTSAGADGGGYAKTNLVADRPGVAVPEATRFDSDLVNAWGLVHGPTTPWWVSDNGVGKSTLYRGDGTKVPLTVNVPPSACSGNGTPTGVVFSMAFSFTDCSGNAHTSRFIFSTEDGTIAAWDLGLPTAVTVVDNGPGAVYKGLAVIGGSLYATNFRAGTVDVFDSGFHQQALGRGAFSDPGIKRGFAPFGIAAIAGQLYVTYAKQDAARHDDVAGPANGYVDVFDAAGNLVRRAATRGRLNSPWGVALAPANFGRWSNELLVGNFGDGRINVVDPATGEFLDQLRGGDNRPFTIDGLWALVFGGGNTNSGATNALYFTAGPNGEADGLFGNITPAP
jgi:uncharacterized protein (TIGR03118 family)